MKKNEIFVTGGAPGTLVFQIGCKTVLSDLVKFPSETLSNPHRLKAVSLA